jgi:hypothetical protein
MWSNSILEVIGNTPLVRLNRIGRGLRPTLLAKLEYLNPGGSVKDRIGIAMLEAAEKAGRISSAAPLLREHRATPDGPRPGCGDQGIPLHLHDAGQDEPGED